MHRHYARLGKQEEQKKIRIVLVGKTGNGKSATGSTILRQKQAFRSRPSSCVVTSTCEKKRTQLDDQTLDVVDTPGLFDPDETEEKLAKNMGTCMSLAAPGPHVFLVVLKPDRFTPEEQETVKNIQKLFGEEASHYTMALFTHGDDLEEDGISIDKLIAENEDLSAFIRRCGGGYHVFNNRDKEPSQVRELLEKINTMVQMNGGSYYTTEMFKEAERVIEEEKEKRMREDPTLSQEEARRHAEKDNSFLKGVCTGALAVVGSAAGVAIEIECGAVAGGMVGGPVGAAVGAAAGLVVAAVIAAVKKYKKKSEDKDKKDKERLVK